MGRTKINPNRAEQIIEAAEYLFARYGYERTNMDSLAEHLGISKGSIYLDFRTKDDILMRIIEKHADRMLALQTQKLQEYAESPLTALKEWLHESVLQIYDCVTRDIHTPEALLHTSAQMKLHFLHCFKRKRVGILELLQRAADAGEISQETATDDLAMALTMGMSSLKPPYHNNYSEEIGTISREELASRSKILIDLLVSGLRKPA